MGRFCYRYGGLVFHSTAPLPLMPDLTVDEPGVASVDVRVEFGLLPIPDALCVRAKPHFQMFADGTCILRSPEGIRLLFDNGRALRLEVPDGLDARLVQSWLIGPGLGLILHQRGTPPLHACAVSLTARAITIVGDSGAGKSTTARALMHRGHRLLAEDQVIVDPVTRLLHPGVPDLRLWAEAASLFGDPMEEAARVGSAEEKFTITAHRDRFDPHPRPLAALFVLSAEPADQPTAVRLGTGAAAAALHRHVYRLRLASFMGEAQRIYRWATALAAQVPVFVLRRPRDLARLDDLAAQIERAAELAA